MEVNGLGMASVGANGTKKIKGYFLCHVELGANECILWKSSKIHVFLHIFCQI